MFSSFASSTASESGPLSVPPTSSGSGTAIGLQQPDHSGSPEQPGAADVNTPEPNISSTEPPASASAGSQQGAGGTGNPAKELDVWVAKLTAALNAEVPNATTQPDGVPVHPELVDPSQQLNQQQQQAGEQDLDREGSSESMLGGIDADSPDPSAVFDTVSHLNRSLQADMSAAVEVGGDVSSHPELQQQQPRSQQHTNDHLQETEGQAASASDAQQNPPLDPPEQAGMAGDGTDTGRDNRGDSTTEGSSDAAADGQ